MEGLCNPHLLHKNLEHSYELEPTKLALHLGTIIWGSTTTTATTRHLDFSFLNASIVLGSVEVTGITEKII